METGLALGEGMERRFLKRQKEKLTLERGSEGCLVLRHMSWQHQTFLQESEGTVLGKNQVKHYSIVTLLFTQAKAGS